MPTLTDNFGFFGLLVEFRYSFENGQTGAGCVLGIIFVRFGPAEVCHHAVAEIFGDVAAAPGDRFGGGTMIAGYQLSPFFRVELSRDFG
jgi:hypothetical protein